MRAELVHIGHDRRTPISGVIFGAVGRNGFNMKAELAHIFVSGWALHFGPVRRHGGSVPPWHGGPVPVALNI